MSKFYTDLFGWKFTKQSLPGMDYRLIEISGRRPTDLEGGMYHMESEAERPRFYVDVENIDSHIERLKQAGGSVLVGKQEFLALA